VKRGLLLLVAEEGPQSLKKNRWNVEEKKKRQGVQGKQCLLKNDKSNGKGKSPRKH